MTRVRHTAAQAAVAVPTVVIKHHSHHYSLNHPISCHCAGHASAKAALQLARALRLLAEGQLGRSAAAKLGAAGGSEQCTSWTLPVLEPCLFSSLTCSGCLANSKILGPWFMPWADSHDLPLPTVRLCRAGLA